MTIDFCTTLAPDNTSPRLARAFVRASLDGRVEPAVLDDVLLLASEIVTNVVRHAGTDAELHLAVVDGCVRLSCRDHSEVLPQPRHAGPQDETGRGLYLIDTIADAWGIDVVPHDGKVVWVQLNRRRSTRSISCAG